MKNLLKQFAASALAAGALASSQAMAAGISEPATTFYGKVLGTADVQPFLISEGRLAWVIRRADGADVALTATLFAYNDGQFSYRLDVPHAALSLGQSAAPGNVPLALSEQTHRHLSVTLDGAPVTLLGPAGSTFTAAQLLRSSTYRLDLGVSRHATDTDGDGLPDWWEDLYGLDKQSDDADQIFGAGGVTAAQAYSRGLDPTADHTVPALVSKEALVFAGGSTALVLDVSDVDTPAAGVIYTVTGLPASGALLLRGNDGSADAGVQLGASFTQADVLQGRLVYQHDKPGEEPGRFAFSLTDGAHAPVAADVQLLVFEPALEGPTPESGDEALRRDLYEYAQAGFVIAQGHDVDASSSAVSYALVGTNLSGGAGADIVIARREPAGVTLLGQGGGDRFVLTAFSEGVVDLPDFSVAEGDVLDLTGLPAASGEYLTDVVTVTPNELVFSTGLTVRLPALAPAELDLYALVASGALVTDLGLEARLSVTAPVPVAYRNGPVSGMLRVTRQGDASRALSVNALLAGTAVNGTDYLYIPLPLSLPSGANQLDVLVTPYAYQTDVKVASLSLLEGSGYSVGAGGQTASVTIEPLRSQLHVEALEPLAVKEAGQPGYFLVWRDGVTGSSLYVQLALSGTAVRNVDYSAAPSPSVIGFAAGDAEKLVEVSVLSGADLSQGPKSVVLTATPSSRYLISALDASAAITLIERFDTFESWLSRQDGFMKDTGDGASSPLLFKRYAFGADAAGLDTAGFPTPLAQGDGALIVRVKQRIGLLDARYSVRGFTSLADPAGSAVSLTPVAAPAGQPDGLEWRYYRLNASGRQGFVSVDLLSD
jgi:hypothetical protein